MLKRHGIRIGRALRDTALSLDIGLGVVVLHRALKVASFRNILVESPHCAVRRLVRGFLAHRLAGRFHDPLRMLVWRKFPLCERFTFPRHKSSLKCSTVESGRRSL